jgi:hypothetical protein
LVTPESSLSSNEGESNTNLAEVDPCGLISDNDFAALGRNIRQESASELSCAWASEGVSSEEFTAIQIDIRPNQSVDDVKLLTTGKLVEGTIGDRKARKIAADTGEGACIISFAAEAGRVDVLTEAYTTERGCAVAERVAEIIESKVPKPTRG